MDKLLFTPEEAAERLSIGRSRIFEMIGSGRLRSVRIGVSRRIPADALTEFVEELTGKNVEGSPQKILTNVKG